MLSFFSSTKLGVLAAGMLGQNAAFAIAPAIHLPSPSAPFENTRLNEPANQPRRLKRD
jgi:hypothetical protein